MARNLWTIRVRRNDIGDPDPEPAAAPINLAAPELVGTPEVGQEVTIDVGTWNPASPDEFEYRWRTEGGTIAGQTVDGFTLRAVDDRHQVTASVRARMTDGLWSDWIDSDTVDVTYSAPVKLGDLSPAVFTAGELSGPSDFIGRVTVPGDPTKASLIDTIQSGTVPAGMDFEAGILEAGIPTGVRAAANLVIHFGNSGGSVTITQNIEVVDGTPAAPAEWDDAFTPQVYDLGDPPQTYALAGLAIGDAPREYFTEATVFDLTIVDLGGGLYGHVGQYGGDPLPIFARRWTLDNVPISGATGSRFQDTGLDGTLRLEIDVDNDIGTPATKVSDNSFALNTGAIQPTIASSLRSGLLSPYTSITPYPVPYGNVVAGQTVLQFATTGNGQRLQTPPAAGPAGEAIATICLNVRDTLAPAGDKVALSIIAWKATTSYAAGTLNWALNVADQWETASMVVNDVDLANWLALAGEIQTFNSDTAAAASVNPIPTPPLTVAEPNSLIIVAIGSNVDDVNQLPTGYTLIRSGDSGGAAMCVARRDAYSAGAGVIPSANFGVAEGPRHYAGAVFALRGM